MVRAERREARPSVTPGWAAWRSLLGAWNDAGVTQTLRLCFADGSINHLWVDIKPYSIDETDIFRLTGSQLQHDIFSLGHGCRDLIGGGRIVLEEDTFNLRLTDYFSVDRDFRLICATEGRCAVEVDPGLIGTEYRQCAFDATERWP